MADLTSMEKLQKHHDDLAQQIQNETTEQATLEADIADLSGGLADLQQSIIDALAEVTDATSVMTEIGQQFNKPDDIKAVGDARTAVTSTQTALKQTLTDAQTALDTKKQALDAANQTLETKSQELDAAEKALVNLSLDIQTATQTLNDIRTKAKEALDNHDAIEGLIIKTDLQQALDKLDATKDKSLTYPAHLTALWKTFSEKYNAYFQQVPTIATAQKEFDSAQTAVANAQAALDDATAKFNEDIKTKATKP